MITIGYRLILDRSDGNGELAVDMHIICRVRQGDDAATSNVNSVINRLEKFFQELKELNLIEV